MGEAFAKKKLACVFEEKFEVELSGTKGWDKLSFIDRNLNNKITMEQMMVSVFIRNLMVKADQCTDSSLISYTTKCCSYRMRYYRELKSCKKYTDLRKRKLCRAEVNSLYP